MGILLQGVRLRVVTAIAVLGLGATACGDDAQPVPTDTPPPAVTPMATTPPAAAPTATVVPPAATVEETGNPLLAEGAFTGGDVVVESPVVDLLAYQAVADGTGSRPAVIVIHENRGLTPFIKDVVDGLASNGYLAIAPDLLSHEGGTA
ncbi:MAG: dienelactone hydrolase family protein, partial [Dehalococcoidia bacterium]